MVNASRALHNSASPFIRRAATTDSVFVRCITASGRATTNTADSQMAMTSKGVTLLKFVGTVSLGLLTVGSPKKISSSSFWSTDISSAVTRKSDAIGIEANHSEVPDSSSQSELRITTMSRASQHVPTRGHIANPSLSRAFPAPSRPSPSPPSSRSHPLPPPPRPTETLLQLPHAGSGPSPPYHPPLSSSPTTYPRAPIVTRTSSTLRLWPWPLVSPTNSHTTS